MMPACIRFIRAGMSKADAKLKFTQIVQIETNYTLIFVNFYLHVWNLLQKRTKLIDKWGNCPVVKNCLILIPNY